MFVLDVDDVLCFHHMMPRAAIKEIDKYCTMKKNVTGDSGIGLGTKLGNVEMINRVHSWSMSPTSK
jgi:hypothetical protein